MYKRHNEVECLFHRFKGYCRICFKYEEFDVMYLREWLVIVRAGLTVSYECIEGSFCVAEIRNEKRTKSMLTKVLGSHWSRWARSPEVVHQSKGGVRRIERVILTSVPIANVADDKRQFSIVECW
ncbi:transposase [Xylella taiwanensis]|uniref:Transposase n=1 Tax=Xylella taiwanensis TaxID=1444770 RepID=Z9JMA3_9GAMM|nr:transposase [Xylella taiwanensis]